MSSGSINNFLELVLASGPETEPGLRNTLDQLPGYVGNQVFMAATHCINNPAYLYKTENERLEEMPSCKLMVSYEILCRAGISLENDRESLDVYIQDC